MHRTFVPRNAADALPLLGGGSLARSALGRKTGESGKANGIAELHMGFVCKDKTCRASELKAAGYCICISVCKILLVNTGVGSRLKSEVDSRLQDSVRGGAGGVNWVGEVQLSCRSRRCGTIDAGEAC